jgi:ribulose-5-phosphate 4-epimerase/fuculose-1-phosphate aldolase
MILHNHGLVSLGSTVEEAFANIVLLVNACEYQVGYCVCQMCGMLVKPYQYSVLMSWIVAIR